MRIDHVGHPLYAALVKLIRTPSCLRRRAQRRFLDSYKPVLGAVLLAIPGPAAANETPTGLSINSVSVRGHEPAGTIVGILRASDPDANDTHSYSMAPGAGADDNAWFAITADTLRTAAVLDHATQSSFHVRIRTADAFGEACEQSFHITLTDPSFVRGYLDYFLLNPTVSNLTFAVFDQETRDYFWVFQNALAAAGEIDLPPPANTPADDATTGSATVYLSATEQARIVAAKAAHAIRLDKEQQVPWRLADFEADHLRGLFDKALLFNRQSSTVFYCLSVVDHSPSAAYRYAVEHNLIRDTVTATVSAVLDDLRSDFLHGSSSYGDPSCAYLLERALTVYSATRFRPARISRSGCHSMTRILIGLLRSLNIPGYETNSGAYFQNLHSEAVFPCIGRVLPHGDHAYSATLRALPSDELMPTTQFFEDNLYTPPCAGQPVNVASRYEALRGTVYPSPTTLQGVKNPGLYGYADAVSFLAGYAGWDRGLTAAELDDAAQTLLNDFNQTRHLALLDSTGQHWVLNMPNTFDYALGTRVLLKALPKEGFRFSHWTGNVPPGGTTDNPLVLSMDTDKSLRAVFTPLPFSATLLRGYSGEFQLAFPALADVPYAIEFRTDLKSGAWDLLFAVPTQSESSIFTYTDPSMPGVTQRFYRVVSPSE